MRMFFCKITLAKLARRLSEQSSLLLNPPKIVDVSIGIAINLVQFAEAAGIPAMVVVVPSTRSLSQIKQVEQSGGNLYYFACKTSGSGDSWLLHPKHRTRSWCTDIWF